MTQPCYTAVDSNVVDRTITHLLLLLLLLLQVTIQQTAVDAARSTVQKATVIVKTVSASARLVCSEPRVICRVPMTLGVLTVYSSVAAMDRTVSAATQKYVTSSCGDTSLLVLI